MKAVIPAKNSSTRVPGKNFRPFYKDLSLFDIKILQLLDHFAADDIYVSSEDASIARNAARWKVNFLERDPILARNETPYASVVSEICRGVPGDDDLAWCHVTDPLFDEYGACVEQWSAARAEHDSLVVVYPMKVYLLDEDHRPMGFGFGPWHTPSQRLPVRYQLGFTLSLLRRDTATALGPIGANPSWFHAGNRTVDIDDLADFRQAQAIYRVLRESVPEVNDETAP